MNLISEIELLYSAPSDHTCVLCKLTVPQPKTSRIKIAYRKTKSIDIDCLSRDISLACVNIITPHFDVNNVSARLNSILQNLLDIHAPLFSRVITCRPKSPWYKSDFRDAKRSKWRARRRYLISRLATHLTILKEKCRIYNECLNLLKPAIIELRLMNVTIIVNLDL